MDKQILHYPRLDTILMVEKLLKKAEQPLSKNEIDRRIPKQVMRSTMNTILNYLEESGKIAILKEGIIWIHREDLSSKLKERLAKGITIK